MKHRASEQTEVCITVDTEFSIGGTFANPAVHRPVGALRVSGEVNGKEEGLGFLLSCLVEHEMSATFFVEALNSCYFGDAPMGAIARRILAAGQDVQLHLHPCWTIFRNPLWPVELPRGEGNDSWFERTPEEIHELISLGLQTFERWGVPRPIALRTGNLQASSTIYQIMSDLHIPLASNIGIGRHNYPRDPALHLTGGRHWLKGVLELPVLTYADLRFGSWSRRRLLTLAAVSTAEIEHLLWEARCQQISPIVILVHPFDLVKTRDVQHVHVRRNRVNQNRLRHLCRFLRQHENDFISVSFRQGYRRWLCDWGTSSPQLVAQFSAVLRRVVENTLNDLIWSY